VRRGSAKTEGSAVQLLAAARVPLGKNVFWEENLEITALASQ
jgi:hypothetical protein